MQADAPELARQRLAYHRQASLFFAATAAAACCWGTVAGYDIEPSDGRAAQMFVFGLVATGLAAWFAWIVRTRLARGSRPTFGEPRGSGPS